MNQDGLVFDPAKDYQPYGKWSCDSAWRPLSLYSLQQASALEEKIARMVPISGTGSTVSTNEKPHEVASSLGSLSSNASTLNHASLTTNKAICNI